MNESMTVLATTTRVVADRGVLDKLSFLLRKPLAVHGPPTAQALQFIKT